MVGAHLPLFWRQQLSGKAANEKYTTKYTTTTQYSPGVFSRCCCCAVIYFPEALIHRCLEKVWFWKTGSLDTIQKAAASKPLRWSRFFPTAIAIPRKPWATIRDLLSCVLQASHFAPETNYVAPSLLRAMPAWKLYLCINYATTLFLEWFSPPLCVIYDGDNLSHSFLALYGVLILFSSEGLACQSICLAGWAWD